MMFSFPCFSFTAEFCWVSLQNWLAVIPGVWIHPLCRKNMQKMFFLPIHAFFHSKKKLHAVIAHMNHNSKQTLTVVKSALCYCNHNILTSLITSFLFWFVMCIAHLQLNVFWRIKVSSHSFRVLSTFIDHNVWLISIDLYVVGTVALFIFV